MNDYSIPRPAYPTTARVLTGAVLIALFGLSLVAYQAFRLIDNALIAAAFALTIEAGAVSEALSILKRNRPAIGGLIVSLAVSAIYNFTHAEQSAAGLAVPLGNVQLWALAIGPLSAALFLSLSLSHELGRHEQALAAWEANRAAWEEAQEAKAAARLREHQERQERKEAADREHQERLHLAELREETKRERARERANLPGTSTQTSTPLPGTSIRTSRGNYKDFQELLRSNGHHEYKNAELAERFNVSTRTVTEWRKRYQTEHPTPLLQEATN